MLDKDALQCIRRGAHVLSLGSRQFRTLGPVLGASETELQIMRADPEAEGDRPATIVGFCTIKKHALACLYLWESLELDNTDLTLPAKLPPEAGER